jgi:hypothetical protein
MPTVFISHATKEDGQFARRNSAGGGGSNGPLLPDPLIAGNFWS